MKPRAHSKKSYHTPMKSKRKINPAATPKYHYPSAGIHFSIHDNANQITFSKLRNEGSKV